MKKQMEVKRGKKQMPKSTGAAIVLAVFLVLLMGSGRSALAQNAPRMELAANYTFVHSNAPPGDCGCFSMNGGAGWFAYGLMHGIAAVGEVGSVHASDIDGTTAGLTITSYLAGPRYSRRFGKMFVPFAQVLLGGAHADGDLTFVRFGVAKPANSFALAAGGGVDIGLTRHWAVRAGQVDYFLTRFSNGVNDHQNNLRVSAGIIFRFGGK